MNQNRLQALEKFLEQDPNDSFTRYAIAMEYISMNNANSATMQLQELLARDSKYIPAYHQLGLLLARNKKPEESKNILRQGIQIAKQSGDAHAQSEMQEALDELEDA